MNSLILPAENRGPALSKLLGFLEFVFPGKPVRCRWEIAKRERTHPQNAYLFGVAYPLLAKAKGYDVDDIHEWMCGKFFGWVDKPCPRTPRNPDGLESVPFRTTTRDENGRRDVLSTTRFSDFVDMVQRVGASAGVLIPDADPEYWRAAA